MHSGHLSQIFLPNMWLLVLIGLADKWALVRITWFSIYEKLVILLLYTVLGVSNSYNFIKRYQTVAYIKIEQQGKKL